MTPAWVLAVLAIAATPCRAQAPTVAVTATPELVSLRPGTAFRVALRLSIPEGWHINWKRPGQTGLPTTITWRTPSWIAAGEAAWPFPELLDTAGTRSHVYRGEVILLTPFRVRADAASGPIDLVADLSWGICREICIPQERRVVLSLPVGTLAPQPSPAWAAVAAAANAQLPVAPAHLTLRATATQDGVRLVLHAQGRTTLPTAPAVFFPEDSTIRTALILQPRLVSGDLVFTLRAYGGVRVTGVLVSDEGWGGADNPRALKLDLPVERAR